MDLQLFHFQVDPSDEQESVGLLYLQWLDWAVKDDGSDLAVGLPLSLLLLSSSATGSSQVPKAYLS